MICCAHLISFPFDKKIQIKQKTLGCLAPSNLFPRWSNCQLVSCGWPVAPPLPMNPPTYNGGLCFAQRRLLIGCESWERGGNDNTSASRSSSSSSSSFLSSSASLIPLPHPTCWQCQGKAPCWQRKTCPPTPCHAGGVNWKNRSFEWIPSLVEIS